MEGLGSVRCSVVSLGPTGQVVPTGWVVTKYENGFIKPKRLYKAEKASRLWLIVKFQFDIDTGFLCA